MPAREAHNTLLDALKESNQAVLDAIKRGNERGYRFSKRLVNEVQQGSREVSLLRQRFARRPKNMRGLYESSVELARQGAGHSAQLAKEFLAGATDAGQDVRETARTVIRANRSAAQAMAAAVQAAAQDLGRSVRRGGAPTTRRTVKRRLTTSPRRRVIKKRATPRA